MPPEAPYLGRTAALATLHAKDRFIAPVLHDKLGLALQVVPADTDRLGTFSGEIPRPAGPLQTAVRKARLGMEATGLPLGVASEGTIADPSGFGLAPLNNEIVVLVDDERGITVAGFATRHGICAVATTVSPGDPTADLMLRANVPPHHLVVSPAGTTPTTGPDHTHRGPATGRHPGITKGVANTAALRHAITVAAAHSPHGHARIETDLRAHLCPSRQPTIAAAASDLAVRLTTPCPTCAEPGWGIASVELGLPCAWCGGPTDDIAGHRWACPTCDAHHVVPTGDPGDPARCPRCNP